MGLASSIMKIEWLKITGVVLIICLSGLILWGAGNYYFRKPIPIVNNYTAPVTNIHNEIKAKQHLITGLYGNKDTYGGFIGWLW
jgi:hypothetical protein